MKGTRKSSPPPAVLLATTSRISWTEATCRSLVCDVRDTPARLIESLTTLIRVSTGTPSSVTFTASSSRALSCCRWLIVARGSPYTV